MKILGNLGLRSRLRWVPNIGTLVVAGILLVSIGGCVRGDNIGEDDVRILFDEFYFSLEDSDWELYRKLHYFGDESDENDRFAERFFEYDVAAYRAGKLVKEAYGSSRMRWLRANSEGEIQLASAYPSRDEEGRLIIEVTRERGYRGGLVDISGVSGPFSVRRGAGQRPVIDMTVQFPDLDLIIENAVNPAIRDFTIIIEALRSEEDYTRLELIELVLNSREER